MVQKEDDYIIDIDLEKNPPVSKMSLFGSKY
jgi:hypothetical protein